MKWSWRIGQVAGIGIYIHSTFVILLFFVAAQHLFQGQSVSVAALAMASTLGLFGIVVLHELGHAMAARYFGIRTQDITLLPIGGVARLERMPEEPKQEFVVALAGPAVNVVLAGIAFVLMAWVTPNSNGERVLKAADANGDGAVTFEELSAVVPGLTLEHFDQYDLDHNRVLTRNELSGTRGNPLQRAMHTLVEYSSNGAAMEHRTGVGRVIGGSQLVNFFLVNVVLVVFNLLPAFPMDGGRVLRALLAMRLDYARATRIAATIGQGMAFLFCLAGLSMWHPLILFIAVFVWMGAAAESELVQTKTSLRGAYVREAMITDFRTLSPSEPLSRAIAYVLAGFQQDFPVLEDRRLVGLLTRNNLLTAIEGSGQDARVGDAMQLEFETAGPTEMLDSVFHRLQESDCRTVPVLDHGVLVGMVTVDNLAEFMTLRSALRGSEART